MAKRLIVAIDGPAGAGKSTLARRVAERMGAVYIDTGAMYRAVALWAVRQGAPLDDPQQMEVLAQHARIEFLAGAKTVLLNGEDVTAAIREPAIASAASQVAALPGVRRAMVAQQREIAAQSSVVMEGRDIGTVVFPDAQVKIYLDASAEVRTARRLQELTAKGLPADPDELRRQMEERDARDRNREASPLLQAADATYLDSSTLTPSEVEEAILRIVRERTSNGKEHHS
jgi:cytidylate kinase